jgi:hypothetical protein
VDQGGPWSSWASKRERVAAYGALTFYMLVLLGALYFIL